ncbi:MAG TPA: hypothetical protein VE869_05625 [Gemmatimonas sp.]|nr:hypothetical protein [Gemmatimonas sp.]
MYIKQLTSILIRVTMLASAFAAAVMVGSNAVHAQGTASPLRDHLDGSRLAARRDSFVVVIQGAPRGWQVLSVAREGDGWTLGDAVAIDGMVSQASTMRFDARLDELSLRQEGVMMGKPMRITLDAAGGRVKGTALTPSNPAGELAIDVPHTDGLVDDNAVASLLAIVHWREGLQIAFPVLASGTGTVSQFTLRTLGKETVSVPAGQFDTWQVELRMNRARMVANITTAAPYRVVRMSSGPAFEMQLAR